MRVPNLTNIWEFAIKLPKGNLAEKHFKILKTKVIPAIKILKKKFGVKWYCFLIHNNKNGVPIKYKGPQYHIRFENIKHYTKNDLFIHLPSYCEKIQHVNPESIKEIKGLRKELFVDKSFEIGWQILGEQCEWVISFMNKHQKIDTMQVCQFLHYWANIFQVRIG